MDMEPTSFDTLKLARRLETAGLAASISAGVSEALADVFSTTALATKADVADSELAVRADMKAMETGIRTDMKAMETGLRTEIKAGDAELRNDLTLLRTEMRGGFDLVRRDMEILRRDATIKTGGMFVAAVGILLTAMRYWAIHP